MNYPPNTLYLPYKCEDDACICHSTLTDLPYEDDMMAHPDMDSNGWWTVKISSNAGMLRDEFRGPDLNGLLESVHRAYPDAEFDPEAA